MPAPLLEVRDLAVDLPVGKGHRPVITDVSFSLRAGESLGLVGESGSGKSMTVRSALRLLPAGSRVAGSIRWEGEDVYAMSRSRLRSWHASEVGFIHQDPRAHINPLRTIGDFLTEGLRASGVGRRESVEKAEALLERVGITEPRTRMRQYPHELSGGLLQRVMIASVLLVEPKLIIADEPTTALDVTIQESVMAILDDLRRHEGVSLVMITHDLDLAAAVTDRIAVVYAGQLVEEGASGSIHTEGLHPYSVGLLESRPSTTRRQRLRAIPGRPVAAFEAPPGCVFVDRCAHAVDTCREERPSLRPVQRQLVACHRAEDLQAPVVLAAGGAL
ncbi:ABC transporter ATP-binding protein [Nocardioides sp. GY 10127]|nr:ABC transporter ATP-binding protein [Nocardioides sp. GY 10127]